MPTGPPSLAYARATGRHGFTAGRRPSKMANASRSPRPKAPSPRGTSYGPSPLSAGFSPTYKRYRIPSYRRKAKTYPTPSSSHPSGGTTYSPRDDLTLRATPLTPHFRAKSPTTRPRQLTRNPNVSAADGISMPNASTSSPAFDLTAGSQIQRSKGELRPLSNKMKGSAVPLRRLSSSTRPQRPRQPQRPRRLRQPRRLLLLIQCPSQSQGSSAPPTEHMA